MNILIQIRETATDKEIKEFTEGDGNNVFISHSTEESIAMIKQILLRKSGDEP